MTYRIWQSSLQSSNSVQLLSNQRILQVLQELGLLDQENFGIATQRTFEKSSVNTRESPVRSKDIGVSISRRFS